MRGADWGAGQLAFDLISFRFFFVFLMVLAMFFFGFLLATVLQISLIMR